MRHPELAAQLGLQVTRRASDGARVPEPDGLFDSLLFDCMLEHIRALDSLLDGVVRLLQPGGLFVLTCL